MQVNLCGLFGLIMPLSDTQWLILKKLKINWFYSGNS